MHLKSLELNGFKSFANKSEFVFDVPIIAIVGPNGSGKSNVVEAIRFVLGEQSVKSMRGKTGSDLIFKGSKEVPKMSRASVTITFDNTDRVFHIHQDNNQRINVDFDEVSISREVYSDGSNTYLINGAEVRMRDVHELIASVNIGSSGHHIISQGEADRYLNANVKDRRELIEEALGLKVYQYRIKESERKLKRAEDNVRETELLRRELAPHLRFLKKQVEKIEKAKELRTELEERYQLYFAQEDYLIKKLGSELDEERAQVQTEYDTVQGFLNTHQPHTQDTKTYQEETDITTKQKELETNNQEVLTLRQELGSIEGMITLLNKQKKGVPDTEQHAGFSFKKVRAFLMDLVGRIDKLDTRNVSDVVSVLADMKREMESFVHTEHDDTSFKDDVEMNNLERKREEVTAHIDRLGSEQRTLQDEIRELERILEEKRTSERESERQYYEYLANKKELDGRRTLIASRDESLGVRMQAYQEEQEEAKVLIGDLVDYQTMKVANKESITSQQQEHMRREIERMKIRLEDMGGGSGVEVTKEYEETLERDQFLEKEITDITTSIESLNAIIAELKSSLDTRFQTGVKKINQQFDHFFKLMFGGGKAELDHVLVQKRKKRTEDEDLELPDEDDNEEKEYGIDIKVQLPRKKVSDLDMLSGGERSLTSIALLFALSQVNPPPFLVLDETDAALDEANSQKYGDMIESLSKYSQLVLVTHNRETMSRAQTLFGVTLGRGDASTMLSLRLEDATKYAK
ncbi:AAA family ATPase [Patescibacteria group bacterium]|nr:AAA family ATPase [Patescibacteria group bacterium]